MRFMIDGAEAGEHFSLVEHPMSPRALAAPLHRHTREDEYSYVLEGRMGALLGDDVVEAGPATWSSSRATSGTLEMQPESVPELLERFGLRIGEQLAGGWTPR